MDKCCAIRKIYNRGSQYEKVSRDRLPVGFLLVCDIIYLDNKLINLIMENFEFQENNDFGSKKIDEENLEQKDNIQESLTEYAQEKYKEYIVFDPENAIFDLETKELLNTIDENRKEFEDEILPNVSEKLISQIDRFVDGEEDGKIIAIMNKANISYKDIIASKYSKIEKVRTILHVILKEQTYYEALENNKDNGIDFNGFEDDPDISDVEDYVNTSFDSGLLEKLLISKIEYSPDEVYVKINRLVYALPIDVYAQWIRIMPEVKKMKFRADNASTWNTDLNFSKKFIPTPIRIYSFFDEQVKELSYLKDIPEKEKMRMYKLGTISHEIGHHIYSYLMSTDMRKEWNELVDSVGDITEYATLYSEDKLKYEEFFTEAIRLKTTVPEYFKRNFPGIEQFFINNFSNIKGPIDYK